MKKILMMIVIALVFVGCKTRLTTKFYPPNKDTRVEVKDENGNVTEIHGAIQEKTETSSPDLGTEGLGEYNLIKVAPSVLDQ